MTRIEAAEDSFGKANTFFVLTWAVTALVLITAFVDFRSYSRDVAVNNALVELYSDLESDAAEVAKKLRSSIYLAADYSNEKDGIETLRRTRSEVLSKVVWIENNYASKVPNLTVEDRLVIQPALSFMKAMLLLNDALGDDHVTVEDEPALLLAEHEAGSYLTAEKIDKLRFVDAARYLWLSSLNLTKWNTVLDKHVAALVDDTPRDDLVDDFRPIISAASTEALRSDRRIASELWTKWLRSTNQASTSGAGGKTEARRRASLTLVQSSDFFDQALSRKAELELLAGGRSSSVEIPVLSLPLQLRDAVVAAPWILAFCSLSILIYTRRAIRYCPDEPNDTTVVGNIPSFYASYGLHEASGTIVAFLLVLLPSSLMAVLLPILQPVLIAGLDTLSVVFFAGVGVALLLGLFTFTQIPSVLKLIDLGIATMFYEK